VVNFKFYPNAEWQTQSCLWCLTYLFTFKHGARYIGGNKLTLSCYVLWLEFDSPYECIGGCSKARILKSGSVWFESLLGERDLRFLLIVSRKMSHSVSNRLRPLSSKSFKIRHSSRFLSVYMNKPLYVVRNRVNSTKVLKYFIMDYILLLHITLHYITLHYTHIRSVLKASFKKTKYH